MAKKIILVDDLDESSEKVQTYRFSLNGEGYEIDLAPHNFTDLEELLAPYVAAGRKTHSSKRKGKAAEAAPKNASDFSREERVAIREWAREHGYEVADRGAFSKEVLAAYRQAKEEDGDPV